MLLLVPRTAHPGTMKSTLAGIVSALSIVSCTAQSLPQVDLGYEIHQAISYNVSELRQIKKRG